MYQFELHFRPFRLLTWIPATAEDSLAHEVSQAHYQNRAAGG
jgi:hypothetical protein